MEERFMELETRLAFQERATEELSDVVAAQQRQLDALHGELRILAARLRPLLAAETDIQV